ncbi:MAG: pyridoxal 5'-phosphate synthase [Gammaproteobacteria bacterium]|nr:pyridoxal 5'-phosphate synthase [Gammaproteobacteria bacterium]
MNFYWASVTRQIRLRGQVIKISHAESEKYFQGRPRESQIAAYASKQSQPTTPEFLETQFNNYQKQFQSIDAIPCPEHWGGYALIPIEVEFWQGNRYRLHYRVRYTKENKVWNKQSLSP